MGDHDYAHVEKVQATSQVKFIWIASGRMGDIAAFEYRMEAVKAADK